MKVKISILCVICTAMLMLVVFSAWPQVSQGQKSEATRGGEAKFKDAAITGVVIQSVEPFVLVEVPEPMTTIKLVNVSQKEVGYVLLANEKGDTVAKTHYLNNSFPPGATSEATITTESAQGMKVVGVAYLDGQLEAVSTQVEERLREIHDGSVAEISSAADKLNSSSKVTDPAVAVRNSTTPKDSKQVRLFGQMMAAELIRAEIENTPPEARRGRLDRMILRLSEMKAKLKATKAGQ